MTGTWKQPLRLALIVTLVVIAAIAVLAWLTRRGPEQSSFFYEAR